MAHIVPSIDFIIRLKTVIEQGNSVHSGISQAIDNEKDEFSKKMGLWFFYFRNSMESQVQFKTHYQQSLVEILGQGLNGAPVYDHLLLLETEMTEEFDRQWKAYLESLPMKLSLPLLLFFFPSYVILLFGPLIFQFLTEVQ